MTTLDVNKSIITEYLAPHITDNMNVSITPGVMGVYVHITGVYATTQGYTRQFERTVYCANKEFDTDKQPVLQAKLAAAAAAVREAIRVAYIDEQTTVKLALWNKLNMLAADFDNRVRRIVNGQITPPLSTSQVYVDGNYIKVECEELDIHLELPVQPHWVRENTLKLVNTSS